MIDDETDRDCASHGGFDAWAALMYSVCEGGVEIDIDADRRASFAGWVRPVEFFGLTALDHAANGARFERLSSGGQHGAGDYVASLQLAGHCVASQNDRVVRLTTHDLFLFDSTRAGRRIDDGHTFSFRLPRQFVMSYLGYEPEGGLLSRGTLPGRLLSQLVADLVRGDPSVSAAGDAYMQLAVYDLFCAAFARPAVASADADRRSVAKHSEKLFERVCGIIRDGMTDPDLTPSKVAAEAGISLRYLQRLFTPRGTTCVHFIHGLRLDHAMRLLHRQSSCDRRLPLSEIALASGFRDYTFFARKFRERFGCTPGSYAGRD